MDTIWFISGHVNLTKEEFDTHYKSRIIDAMQKNCRFVLGDSRGCDYFARKLLAGYKFVKIYHVGDVCRGFHDGFETIGGFESEDDRDSAMTLASTDDIVWIRPVDQYRKMLGNRFNPMHISSVTKNIMRRQDLR